jgi:Uncharacterised nucleotidyltransferase
VIPAELDDILKLLQGGQVRFWLLGGWAAELVCGRELRPHDDLDFFVHVDDAQRAVQVLKEAGFVHAHGSLEDGDLFLRRGALLLDLVPIQPDPPHTLGTLAGIVWPARLLDPFETSSVPTLTPAMQLNMKRVISEFYGLPLREKDLLDVAALRSLADEML